MTTLPTRVFPSPQNTRSLAGGGEPLGMAFFALLLAWRLALGLLDLRGNADASMLLNIPTWWGYVPLVPSFFLLGLTALYQAHANLRKLRA